MALTLSERDHDTLDRFLDTVLTRFRDKEIDMAKARGTIAEAVALAAEDNATLANYMRADIKGADEGLILTG